MAFGGKQIYVNKFDGKIFLSLTWTEKNILKALNALKNIVFVGEKNVATTWRENLFLLRHEGKKIF